MKESSIVRLLRAPDIELVDFAIRRANLTWKEALAVDLCGRRGYTQAERRARCCADNSIVNYANATFYPKMVADVTTGTGTTAQTLYNPLPDCGDCCCNG